MVMLCFGNRDTKVVVALMCTIGVVVIAVLVGVVTGCSLVMDGHVGQGRPVPPFRMVS